MGEIAIVTGYTGTAHVKSMHDRSRIAGVVGTGAYVLPTGNKLKAEMQNANTVRVLDGDLVLQGCHATIEAGTYQDLKIDNGTQGMKRHDLVVARYERRAQDPKTESVTLKIVKGTPSASPADPDVATGDVLAGNLVSEVALWRIPLDGLNVGDPIALFDVLMPMSELPGFRIPDGEIYKDRQDERQNLGFIGGQRIRLVARRRVAHRRGHPNLHVSRVLGSHRGFGLGSRRYHGSRRCRSDGRLLAVRLARLAFRIPEARRGEGKREKRRQRYVRHRVERQLRDMVQQW